MISSLYIGTAGFSYKDWRGFFYPESVRHGDYLEFYSKRFSCVELDFTYYRQPFAANMAAMVSKVPDCFRFTVKAHRTMTHEIAGQEQLAKEFETFRQGVFPIAESGKLACILFQFPWSFRPSERS